MIELTRKEPYLIAEIGINFNSDMTILKKLIDATFCCEWDCFKLQKRDVDICIPEKQKNIIKQTPWGEMTYLEYKRKMELNKEQYDYIDDYAKEKPIDWSASVWDLNSLEFLLQYDVPFIKIPSAMIENKELVEESAKTNKMILLATGMSTIEEVDYGVNNVLKYNNNLIILHCCSSYPTPIEEINLKCISMLQERYNCDVGLSDHTYGLEAAMIATVLQVKVIEKHITLNHLLWGTDQSSSLEIHGMSMLKKRIRDINVMLGDGIKRITESEIPIREKLRR